MPRACWGSQSSSGRSQCRSSNTSLQFMRPEHPGPAAAPACRGSRRLSALGTPGGGARFRELLTGALGRPVTLTIAGPSEPSLEEYWPEIAHQATVTDEAMPAGMFFDLATIHVLTTATLNRLRKLYPQGRFEVRRFRPNIAVRPDNDDAQFVETSWVERELRIGDDVELEITDHCPRCVMTTLPQGDLPKDSGILRTAARHNEVHVGVYGEVRRTGRVQRDDTVTLG